MRALGASPARGAGATPCVINGLAGAFSDQTAGSNEAPCPIRRRGESLYHTCPTCVHETVDRVTTQIRLTEVFRDAVRLTSQAIIVDHGIICQGRFVKLNARGPGF